MPATRKAYPSDVADEEWAFVAPYLKRLETTLAGFTKSPSLAKITSVLAVL